MNRVLSRVVVLTVLVLTLGGAASWGQVYPELVTKGTDGKIESVQYHELIPTLLNEVQHQQQKLEAQSQQLSAQSQELAEQKAQNERLQAALVQQTTALTARLEQLEKAPRVAAVATR